MLEINNRDHFNLAMIYSKIIKQLNYFLWLTALYIYSGHALNQKVFLLS